MFIYVCMFVCMYECMYVFYFCLWTSKLHFIPLCPEPALLLHLKGSYLKKKKEKDRLSPRQLVLHADIFVIQNCLLGVCFSLY